MLRSLPDALVDCVVTSPAYWGLRDYGTDPIIWGGDPECKHEWTESMQPRGNGNGKSFRRDREGNYKRGGRQPGFCIHCGAWRGSLGLEPTLDLYISHLVEIFREVWRVMKPEATCWINHGDSYAGTPAGNFGDGMPRPGDGGQYRSNKPKMKYGNLKPKDLIGQPWRLAFALQADGWWLRSDVIEEVELYCPCGCGYVLEERIWRWSQDRDLIWAKPNPMPESVKGTGYYRHKIRQTTNGKKEWVDCPGCEKCNPHGGYVLRWNAGRPTKSHEYIFLLSKSAKYYYDAESIKEPCESGPSDIKKMVESLPRIGGKHKDLVDPLSKASSTTNIGQKRGVGDPSGRNKRTVWTIATQPLPMPFFASFPEKLAEPCIRAGTSEKGYCAECGKPWVRVVERTPNPSKKYNTGIDMSGGAAKTGNPQTSKGLHRNNGNAQGPPPVTLGWQPSCSCDAAIVPGLVLDPFGGAGTVALEAKKLNRDFLIIELKPEYCDMSRRRLAERMPLFVGGEVGKD